MKTKKIVAATITEAMGKVKKELGPDAIILYTKKVYKTRWLPPFKKEMVEVVAALDEEPRSKEVVEEVPSFPPKPIQQGGQALQQPSNPIQFGSGGPSFNQVFEQIEKAQRDQPIQPQTLSNLNGLSEIMGTNQLIPDIIRAIYHKLLEIDFRPEISDQVVQVLLREWYSSSETLNRAQLKAKLVEIFNTELEAFSFSGIRSETKLVTLIGPTGVGKTTTAAKLASKAVLEEEKSVAFITTDTYRIAAVDQLKTYAKILNVPISVVYSMDDFQEALTQYKDRDLIIVDSAGRNYQQKKYVNELLQLIPFQEQMETYLVLSATSKTQDLERITDQFASLPITSFLFTKLDETLSIGNLCQLMLHHSYGVTYFTNGQDVPDDILEADRESFIGKLIEGIIHE